MDAWQQRMLEYVRRGQRDRVQFLENDLKRSILPTQLARIQQNDKTVGKELVLPKWLDWELLYEWSFTVRNSSSGTECILCNRNSERGNDFNGKFVCDECFFRIKAMP